MKLENIVKKNKYLVLAVIAVFVFIAMCKNENPAKAARADGKWTVYGTDWCGYTKKQLAYMDDNSIEYEYIECSDGACDGFDIKAFPTLIDSEDNVSTGFRKV